MNDDKISKARTIIGENQDEDYILRPLDHEKLFSPEVPEFASVFADSEVQGIAKQYDAYDKEAISAQNSFKSYSKRAQWAVFLTACCSAALLGVSILLGRPEDIVVARVLFITLSLAAILFGTLATTWLRLIEGRRLLEEWMKQRANAEMRRLEYFNLITSRKPDDVASPDPTLFRLLQLEFFRRFQLDMQINYYRGRGRAHGRFADKAVTMSSWALGGAGLATGFAGFLGSAVGPKWGALAGFGMICQALATWILNKEAVNQDRRNQERYSRTYETLENLKMRLSKARKSIAGGNEEVLPKLVEAVHELVSLEHRQWTDDIGNASKAIGELEQQLKELEKDTGAGSKK